MKKKYFEKTNIICEKSYADFLKNLSIILYPYNIQKKKKSQRGKMLRKKFQEYYDIINQYVEKTENKSNFNIIQLFLQN